MKCVCVCLGAVWEVRDKRIGFKRSTNPVGTGKVLDECLCLACSGVAGVCENWVGGLDQGHG